MAEEVVFMLSRGETGTDGTAGCHATASGGRTTDETGDRAGSADSMWRVPCLYRQGAATAVIDAAAPALVGAAVVAVISAVAAVALCLYTVSAFAGVPYDAVLEWNGPNFRVMNAPLVNQLVDSPIHDIPFLNPRAVAAREHGTGGRDVVYVVDTGRKRVQAFEVNATYVYTESADFAWQDPPVAAGRWGNSAILLPEWKGAADRWVVPFSEILKIDGEAWIRVDDLTGFEPADRRYTIDYGDDADAPGISLPAGSLNSGAVFTLNYLLTDYHGGGDTEFGVGDVDYGISHGAAPVLTAIDESSGGPASWQEVRSIALSPNEAVPTSDDIFLLDSADDSAGKGESLFQFTVDLAGGVTFVEAYDDLLTTPHGMAVARSGSSTRASFKLIEVIGPFDPDPSAVIDASQVTGHTYMIAVDGLLVTVTDQQTGRVLVDNAAFADLADPFLGIPGLSLKKNAGIGISSTINTTAAVPGRYLFVADTGADRIKVISAADGAPALWPGDWLPGDERTVIAQPAGPGTVGALPDRDYRYTTPATVPANHAVYTNARPIKEGTLITITFDPDGSPDDWSRVTDLSLSGPGDKHYEVDWKTGRVSFGDGVRGAIPPASTQFQFDYTTTPDVLRFGGSGASAGRFDAPRGIAARWNSSLGCYDVYVADTGNDRIQKFAFHPENPSLNLPARMDFVCQWSTASSPGDPLDAPVDVAVALDREASGTARACYLAVADQGNDRVVIYRDTAATSGGGNTVPVFDAVLGGPGDQVGFFSSIDGLAWLHNGDDLDLYAVDGGRGTVTKFEEAPGPAVTLSFAGTSALPRCFSPAGSYPFRFTVTNPPAGGVIDFYYDTVPSFNAGTARLCMPQGSVSVDATTANWVFQDTPSGVPADGTGYYLFVRMKDDGGVVVAQDQTGSDELLCLDSDLVPTLLLVDAIDGDNTLYLQNGLERILQLQLAYPESTMAVGFVGSYDTNMVEILSISGNDGVWFESGARDHYFAGSFSPTNGTFNISSTALNPTVGLNDPGPHTMGYIRVRCREDLLTPASPFRHGAITLDPNTSSIVDLRGNEAAGKQAVSINLRAGYLGDFATDGEPMEGSPPNLIPRPDGKINYSDVLAFSRGWNGAGGRRDRLSDIGPAEGEVPDLIPVPDGRWTVDDIVTFTSMFSWASSQGMVKSLWPGAPEPDAGGLSCGAIAAGLWLSGPGDVETKGSRPLVHAVSRLECPRAGAELELELRVEGVHDLMGVLFRLHFDPAQVQVLDVEDGGFLRGREGELFFERSGPDWVEVAVSRLDREDPGVTGSGPVARIRFMVVRPNDSRMELLHDLRSSQGEILSRGLSILPPFAGEPAPFRLLPAFPNPARGEANIVFSLEAGAAIRLDLFDVAGRRVRGLVDGLVAPGHHIVRFDGRDDRRADLPAGVYYCRLSAGRRVETERLVLIR